VELWYNEITDPGYKPGVSPDLQPKVGHYTAMIWKDTGKLGCAQSACPDGSPKPVHVCHYAYSAPNSGADSEYFANVPQSNAPTATEETCCQTIYGDPAAASNPHLNPLATPAPTQAPSGHGPCMGVFTDENGKRTVQLKPWHIYGSTGEVWVYGDGRKLVSVNKDGKRLEGRYSKTPLTDSMSPAELKAAWDPATWTVAADSFTVEVTLGDTSAPAPAQKEFPEKGDAEGTIYTSTKDQGPKRSTRRRDVSIRRRMRGDFYAIAKEVTYTMVKKGAQCRSKNKWYGCWLRSAGDCAKKIKKEGKKYFIWYPGSGLPYDYGKCYGEGTTSAACPEGFSSTGFNGKFSFYSVLA